MAVSSEDYLCGAVQPRTKFRGKGMVFTDRFSSNTQRQPDLRLSLVRILPAALCAVMLALLSARPAPAGAQVVVSPNQYTTTEGNENNSWPFNSYFPIQYQQVYNASEFSAITTPEYVTQIAFRPDPTYGFAFSTTISNIQISMSTSNYSANNLSTTYADNIGADNTVVHSGPLALSSNFTGPVGGPMDFDIIIPFTTPFLYTPGTNILLDVQNYSGGITTAVDAVYNAPSMSRVLTDPETFPYQYSATGGADGTGLITQFTFETRPPSNPEPGAVGIAVGLLSASCLLLKRRQAR